MVLPYNLVQASIVPIWRALDFVASGHLQFKVRGIIATPAVIDASVQFFTDFHDAPKMNPHDFRDHRDPIVEVPATVGWIAMKFAHD